MDIVQEIRGAAQNRPVGRWIAIALIWAALAAAALYFYNAYQAFRPASLPQGTVVVSQGQLEEKYGLRVNLVAMTAAGGFVDVRFKVVDGDKLKGLLADPASYPALFTTRGAILKAPDNTNQQVSELTAGSDLFIMYPNSGNAVQRDKPVTILFGSVALEPIMPR